MKRYLIALTAASLALVGVSTFAVGPQSTNFGLPWSVSGSGGGSAASANYRLSGTAGQPLVGTAQSANYSVGAGYWPGITDFDSDGIFDASDNCEFWANSSQTLPNWPIPPGDSDCDGYSDSVGQTLLAPESYIGTDPTRHCNSTSTANNEVNTEDAWPMDFNDNQLSNGQDFLTFNYSINLNTNGPPIAVPIMGTFERERWDFSGNGIINGQDFLKFTPFINRRCDS
jgi:hypothetical protein